MQVSGRIRRIRKSKRNAIAIGREFFMQIGFFVCGAVVSLGASFGALSPFGAALTSAVPFKYMFSGAAGSVLGYIMLSPANSFRYITIVVAVAAIRWLFSDIPRISRSAFFIPTAAFLPVAATGLALLFSSTSELSDIGLCFTEALAAAGAAYFFHQTITLFLSNRTLTSFNQQEIASVVFAGCILLLSLNVFSVGGVALGRIAAGVFILLCARYGGAGIGSVCGVATGVVFSLHSSDMLFLCGAYAFGGVIAGVFANVGKLGSAIAFAACSGVMAVMAKDSSLMVAVMIETAVACTTFMLLPKTLGNVMSAIFMNSEDTTRGESFKNSVISRLDYAADALANVSDCVNIVSEKLNVMRDPDAEWLFEGTKQKTCNKCGMQVYCWEKEKELTKRDFTKLFDHLQKSGELDHAAIEKSFEKKCCKQRELAKNMNYEYQEMLSCKDAQRRVTQVRAVVAGQFSGLSEILKDMAQEFDEYCKFDIESGERVAEYFKRNDASVICCSCMVNNLNRMTVEVELANNNKGNIKKGRLSNDISALCGRRMDMPNITYAGDKIRIVLSEEPVFYAEVGTSQHVANGGSLCGDSFNYFEDGAGNLVAIISDGMGTGGKAAVDGNMAAGIMKKLVKSGLSFDSALQIVNSSLIVKSEDETSATLDVAAFDMFTGRLSLMKAGAPTTFVRKNGTVMKRELPALPVGILYDVQFSKDELMLNDDDLIVMVSDGALAGDCKWIEKEIKLWGDGKVDELADKIVCGAKNRSRGREDDITALAIRVRG